MMVILILYCVLAVCQLNMPVGYVSGAWSDRKKRFLLSSFNRCLTNEMFAEADESLFSRILANSNHVLITVVPF